jgi:hypothetical protein
MDSDPPNLDGSANAEDEARWEAYRALMRRTGAVLPGLDDDFAEESGSFAPDGTGPVRMGGSAAAQHATSDKTYRASSVVVEKAGEDDSYIFPIRSLARFGARLAGATMILIAGLVIAASPPPARQGRPAVAAWSHVGADHEQPIQPASAGGLPCLGDGRPLSALAWFAAPTPLASFPLPASSAGVKMTDAQLAPAKVRAVAFAATPSSRHVREASQQVAGSPPCPHCRRARALRTSGHAPSCMTEKTNGRHRSSKCRTSAPSSMWEIMLARR